MNENDLIYLAEEIRRQEEERMKQKKEHANSAHWADLTLEELSLIDDKDKRAEYRKTIRKIHMIIVNPLANSAPRKFKLSKPDTELTYRIIVSEYMAYFYNKGMTQDEIIKMMIENRIIKSDRGRAK